MSRITRRQNMRASDLVVEATYEIKRGRKSTKRNDDGFCPAIFLGTEDEGENKVWLFREMENPLYSTDEPVRFYAEELRRNVREKQ
jgi:hypothetical protein